MKKVIKFAAITIIVGLMSYILISCKDSNSKVPEIETSPISDLTQTSVTSGGFVLDDCGSPVYRRGVCWSTNTNPTTSDNLTEDGSGTGNFISSITELSYNTTYYIRAYAINNNGIGYGNCITFTTGIVDIDGNVYKTKIFEWGNAGECFIENLKTTKLNDGTEIQFITDDVSWANTTEPAYCIYNNDSINNSDYGLLYNWAAVETGKLCPEGWHIPSFEEFDEMLSPHDLVYKCGGQRLENGIFIDLGKEGCWWTTTEISDAYAKGINVSCDNSDRGGIIIGNKKSGFSVRCVRVASPY
ncbi:MAG: FISUMP domain-containing protein [Bacteroidales bacterium]|nr:FISUMP domain-containing protein [Bacteroidales bacterium]